MDGLIYVVDGAERDRIEEAKEELDKTLNEDEMRDTVAMVLSQGAGPAQCVDGGWCRREAEPAPFGT